MLKKSFHLVLATVLAAGFAAAQQKPRSETQPRGALVETQGTPGQDAKDEILMYRFRLAASDTDLRLAVTNPSDYEGAFTLAGKAHEVAAGETITLEAWDTEWLRGEGVVVKAPRRLQLSLRAAGSAEGIAVKTSPKTSVYEIYSSERVPSAVRGRRETMGTRSRGSLVLYHSK